MKTDVKLLFGTHPITNWTDEVRKEFLQILQENGIKHLDTAYGYKDSERILGSLSAPKTFTIDTKAPGFRPGSLAKQSLIDGCNKSLSDLQTDSVDIYYLHAPDKETPIEETLAAVDQLYREGKFKRFGLSNFLTEDVQKVYDHCTAKNYILPTVYQGNYNAVARHSERTLLPLLRRLHIAYYVYSPLAGGFLVRTPAQIAAASEGRFDKSTPGGEMYHRLYNRPTLVKALEEWEDIAKEAGVSKNALATRWVVYHSQVDGKKGDGVILGGSKPQQLRETLKAIEEGPLGEGSVRRIEGVWEMVREEAPIDNFNS